MKLASSATDVTTQIHGKSCAKLQWCPSCRPPEHNFAVAALDVESTGYSNVGSVARPNQISNACGALESSFSSPAAFAWRERSYTMLSFRVSTGVCGVKTFRKPLIGIMSNWDLQSGWEVWWFMQTIKVRNQTRPDVRLKKNISNKKQSNSI